MRRLDDREAADRMRWLCGDAWPPSEGATGFDAPGDAEASAWVLHSVYERDDVDSGTTHHDARRQALAEGLAERAVVGGVDLDDVTVTTGGGLGFARRPPPPGRRSRWSDLGRRDGFGFWAVSGRWPDQVHTPQADAPVIPAGSWPRLGLTAAASWPVSVLPPTEGSLDEASLEVLLDVLGGHTPRDLARRCAFYYGAVAFMGEGATVFDGDLHDLPALVTGLRGTPLTPNNIWPPDRSWLVYTDYDLCATRVSGSSALIDALLDNPDLDGLRCA